MNPNNFFEDTLTLENTRARLEPLQPHHYLKLLPIALEKELWLFTSNFVDNEVDFKRYFDNALAERKAGLSYPFAVYDKISGQYAGSTRYGNISFLHKKLEIKTSSLNLKSQAAILKMGAVKEGIFRNHLITERGIVRDTVYYSFIKEEWQATRNKLMKEGTVH